MWFFLCLIVTGLAFSIAAPASPPASIRRSDAKLSMRSDGLYQGGISFAAPALGGRNLDSYSSDTLPSSVIMLMNFMRQVYGSPEASPPLAASAFRGVTGFNMGTADIAGDGFAEVIAVPTKRQDRPAIQSLDPSSLRRPSGNDGLVTGSLHESSSGAVYIPSPEVYQLEGGGGGGAYFATGDVSGDGPVDVVVTPP